MTGEYIVESVALEVPGRPMPQSRPRVTRNGTYNKANPWRESIQWLASEKFRGFPLEGRKCVSIRMTGCSRRPDADNLMKAIFDALQGHAYRNDNQVDKVYFERNREGEPSTSITVSVL